MNNDLGQFKKLYIETAKEQIEIIKTNLTTLVSNDTSNAVNNIFIAAHSLKGQSLMMGYEHVGKIAQIIEKSFRGVKDGKLSVKDINLEVTESVLHKLESWLTGGENSIEPNFDTEEQVLGEISKNI